MKPEHVTNFRIIPRILGPVTAILRLKLLPRLHYPLKVKHVGKEFFHRHKTFELHSVKCHSPLNSKGPGAQETSRRLKSQPLATTAQKCS
jgi:hypothetical protein